MLAQDAGTPDLPEAVLAGPAPAAGAEPLITWGELANFFLLTLGFGALYALLVGAVVAIAALVGVAAG